MQKKVLYRIIVAISFFSALIWVLPLITSFEISDLPLKKIIVFIFLSGATYILFCRIILRKYKNLSFIFSSILILYLGVGINKFNWKSEWRTLDVHFVNSHFDKESIETQYQSTGEWKANYRLVKVTRLTNYFMIAQNVDTSLLNSDWIRNKKY